MNLITTFTNYLPVFEMKEKTRKKLEMLTSMIRRRMAVNPSGLIVSDVPHFLQGSIMAGIQFKVIKRYKDENGTNRLLLIDGDNEFATYDAIRKFTKPEDSPASKATRKLNAGKTGSSTAFLFDRAELTRIARVLPNSPYWLDKIAHIEIGDLESLAILKDEIYEHEDYINSAGGYIKKATNPNDSPTPNIHAGYGKPNNNNNNSNFLLDRADFKRVAKTLPKADYILNKLSLIEIDDIAALHKLRDAVYKYYNL